MVIERTEEEKCCVTKRSCLRLFLKPQRENSLPSAQMIWERSYLNTEAVDKYLISYDIVYTTP